MNIFDALGEPTRRDIITLLARHGETCSGDVAKQFPMSAAGVSQHLRILESAGVLRCRREGVRRMYSINRDAVLEAAGWLHTLT